LYRGAIGFRGCVYDDKFRAVLPCSVKGRFQPRYLRGHNGGILGLAAVFPVRGVGLGVKIDNQ